MRCEAPDETGSAMSFNQVSRYVGYSLDGALSAVVLQAYTPACGGLSLRLRLHGPRARVVRRQGATQGAPRGALHATAPGSSTGAN
jgi:hypothetical protein